jgi:predicted AAA+ superfamily ATPase
MNLSIEKSQLKDIVNEQYLNMQNKKSYVKRHNFERVKKDMSLTHAIVLTGIRRSGKSTLLIQLLNELNNKGIYFSFEDERLLNFKTEDFSKLHEILIDVYGNHKTFFFDEIQNIEGWEKFVRRLMDQGYKCVITGSNASLLSKELGTRLTGRYVSHIVYPFSFKEFLDFYNTTFYLKDILTLNDKVNLKKLFKGYLEMGGMPEYLISENPQVLKTVYDDILYRDIITRYDIKDVDNIRQLSSYLSSTITQIFSYNNLKNLLGFKSVNTIKNYIRYLENSYVYIILNMYTNSPKKNILNPKKIYGIDHCLMSHVGLLNTENYGKKIENITFLELLRRYENINFFRDTKNREVDFIVYEKQGFIPIQVSWSMSDIKTKNREVSALESSMNELDVDYGIILTYEDSGELLLDNGKKIEILPIYLWLIDKY